MIYCKSEAERDEWVMYLQHAAAVVPIEDDYVLGKELGDWDSRLHGIVVLCFHQAEAVSV